MSKYKKIKTKVKKREFICRALEELGVAYEVAALKSGLSLYGYEGRKRPEKAEVVVRRKHVGPFANDLGWTQDEDGTFVEVISEFDANNRGAKIASQVRQKAAFYQLEELAYANGYSLHVVEEHGVQRVFVGGGA